ncbi:heme peroxidase [Ceratobasidium sp. AG-Ba]|nr:heme peroxidase [Ceratobasidium sp. AG-Ba]
MAQTVKNAIDAALTKVIDGLDTIRLSTRPLPETRDGLSDAQAAASMYNRKDKKQFLAQALQDLRDQIKRGPLTDSTLPTMDAILDALVNGKTIGLDDRDMALEVVLVALSRTEPGSVIQQKIQDAVIKLLYADLPHPPATYVGPAAQFRTPDGSENNPLIPDLGKAKTPYARSVQSTTPIPPANLPSPELIFEALLRRDTKGGKPHPAGVSSLLFSFAVLIIHSLFRTSPESPFINDTSSYLDLSPLYGHDWEAQQKVRRMDGTGLLHEDVFAENRLLLMPPAVSALLVLFCRNHNYIATKLYQINENGKFKDPEVLKKQSPASGAHTVGIGQSVGCAFAHAHAGTNGHTNGYTYPSGHPGAHGHHRSSTDSTDQSMSSSIFSEGSSVSTTLTSPTASKFLGHASGANAPWMPRNPLEEQDHVLFNTARLINCGFFMNVIVSDYIGAILGLTRYGSSYSLNPLEEIRGGDHQIVGRGQGNACSVEFNLLYRWHATLSAADETWTEAMMSEQFGGKDPHSITWMDFQQKLADDKTLPKIQQVTNWTFKNKYGKFLQRDPKTGRFHDEDLAQILHDATENVSGAFSARNTPEVMKMVEILGIEQARKWGVCTLNEFRKFIGLKPYESFKDWNPRQEIYEAAQGLYGHPDNLELYVGMQAEEAKPVVAGAGLCPGYTISRAILADAVALTRGDRFLTHDFTPQNFTVWGFQDCQRDVNNGGFGSVLAKILMRTLPEHYTFNSVYALFPFMVPSRMKEHLTDLEVEGQYDFERPKKAREIISVNSYAAVRQVLGDPKTYRGTYEAHMKGLTDGYGFFLAMDNPAEHKKDMGMMHKVMVTSEAIQRQTLWYGAKTTELIKDRSFSMSKSRTRTVDIVRDVLNLVPVHWVSQELAGLPLKCKGNEDGLITEQEMYQLMTVVFTYIFLNVEPLNGWQLRAGATMAAEKLMGIIEGHLEAIASQNSFSIAGLKAWLFSGIYGNDDGAQAFLTSLFKNKGDLTIKQVAYNVFGCMIASVSNYAQAATHIVDFYLDDERTAERKIISELALQDSVESDDLLAGYVREAMRLHPQAPGVFRDVNKHVVLQDGKNTLHLDEDDRLFVSLANSNLDPKAFPDPLKINPKRPRLDYNLFGYGMHKCMGDEFTEKTMPAVIKSVFKLKNVRRAPGASGKLRSFKQDLHGTQQTMYLSNKGTVTPWPSSMDIQYDE